MKHKPLFSDIIELRSDLEGDGRQVLDEVVNYTEFLEEKYDLLDKIVAYLNELEESGGTETKQQILDRFSIIFG